MKDIHIGLQYIGLLAMCIFGGTFLLSFMRTEEVLLDQLLGFTIGFLALVAAHVVKHRYTVKDVK